ncbi:MAG: GMC oxidoreductase, partial [Gemmatimonadales bacterium]
HSVLVLERGRWVDRDDSAWDTRAIQVEGKYRTKSPYDANQWIGRSLLQTNEAVGGNSVFYGGASFRMRAEDFSDERHAPELSDYYRYARWPLGYDDFEPYYTQAEDILGVAGIDSADPTEPPKNSGYKQQPPVFSLPARTVAEAGVALGLKPFPIPLAINFQDSGARQCVECLTCDLYPCKVCAKNDMAVAVLPRAQAAGATVSPFSIVKSLARTGSRITSVSYIDANTREEQSVSCDVCVLSAGAINSTKLLLASGLNDIEPNGRMIGKYLMRHCSGIAMGVFGHETNPERRFHKQVAFTDFYHGHPNGRGPAGPWGMIQGLQVPTPEFISMAPFPLGWIGAKSHKYHNYLLCMAEDAPQESSCVDLSRNRVDPYGIPIASVTHHYLPHDRALRRALLREASRILREANAILRLRKTINTFSHALGTCRFGEDPEHAVLDINCRVHGTDNLFVIDSSFMPTSAGVNPSLTIMANALRVCDHMNRSWSTYSGATM